MAEQSGTSPLSQFGRAMFGPFPIAIAAATVVGSVFGHWLVLVPGAVAWLFAVIATAALPAGRARQAEVVTAGLPPSIQAELRGVNQALDALSSACARVPADQRVMFADIVQQAQQVRDAVVNMARSAGALHNHLASSRSDTTQAELDGLRQRLQSTEDAAQRAQLQATAARAEERLARRQDMMATLDRYRATLRDLQASAEDLADRAVNLAAGGELAMDEAFDEQSPARKITELKASVAALEEVLGSQTEVQ